MIFDYTKSRDAFDEILDNRLLSTSQASSYTPYEEGNFGKSFISSRDISRDDKYAAVVTSENNL